MMPDVNPLKAALVHSISVRHYRDYGADDPAKG